MSICAHKYTTEESPTPRKEAENPIVAAPSESSQYDSRQVESSAFQREIQNLRQKIQKLQSERDQEHCRRILDQLQHAEHYEFDYELELVQLVKLNDQERAQRVDQIRRYHHQRPVQTTIPILHGTVLPTMETTREEGNEAVKMVSRGLAANYEEALNKVRKNK